MLSATFHIPSLLVVNRWAADDESGSHHDFRFRHDVWTMLFRQIGERITSIISIAWYFTTKSGGIWKIRHQFFLIRPPAAAQRVPPPPRAAPHAPGHPGPRRPPHRWGTPLGRGIYASCGLREGSFVHGRGWCCLHGDTRRGRVGGPTRVYA